MGTQLDPQLAQKIVHEVKSQGVFDEFRKDSIADVDTKPAYLNLRQRVENAVQKFLSEQKWTPETNKYQLRERLRRHIAESGFLDVGVERIVDQVVNPKIGSVFQPRIEEIAYKYLGLPPPPQPKRELAAPPLPLPPFPLNGKPSSYENPNSYEKPYSFEALKIETLPIETENLLPRDLEQISPESDKIAVKEEETIDAVIDDDKADDDDESPPFEPLTECKSPIKTENQINVEIKTESIDKIESKVEMKSELENSVGPVEPLKEPPKESSPIKEEVTSVDALASQESQLSQVSSDSRISSSSNQLNQSCSDAPTNSDNAAAANISEEAQMPKFNDNSTDLEGNSKNVSDLHFDIMKDEIKFEGTERKTNHLDGERSESINDAPVIKDDYISDSIEAKGAFHFTKLNVEPCNITQEAASSVSSQDDTSSAQLCIVEKSEQELLQTDTNSVQKISQDESNAASLNNNSQTKLNDEKLKATTSSSTFSRHKKSSSSKDKYRRSPERSRRHDDRDQREKSKYSDKPSESKHSSKISSSSRHHSSSERHSSSSKRNEKGLHRSSSSRSESHSRHSSSKKDHRYDSKKHRSSSSHSKSNRSENQKSRTVPPNDDHNELKEKIHWRKSTDSNDEDKSPSGGSALNGTANIKSKAENTTITSTVTSNTDNTKGKNQDSNKNSSKSNKECLASNSSPNEEPKESAMKINNSNVVIVNDILENPSKGFVEIVSYPIVNTVKPEQHALIEEDDDSDLLYFDPMQNPLEKKLNLLDEAIDHCNNCYKATSIQQTQEYTNSKLSSTEFMTANNNNNNNKNNNNNEIEIKQKTQATLQIDCYHYKQQQQQQQSEQLDYESGNENKATTAKRFKYDLNTECGMSKENQMNEKNAIKTDVGVKKTSLNRIDHIAKQQQQRYTSEDLYKPRPVLSQRSKRRGLDALT